ncbi:MAG: helix-turn-helix transcriptional regulator [Patescibacteria group bacterium]|nr:helix-turn-helix transcriptional regulator [Patescibacteria group bacterium]
MKTHAQFKAEIVKDPRLKASYDRLEPEFRVYSALVGERIKKKLTQRDLAKKLGVAQSALARFESGRGNPTFAWLSKVATALGLKIEVKPV